MDIVRIIELIVSIVSGLAVVIPVVMKLVKTVKELVKEKNWNVLVRELFNLMGEAEKLFDKGTDRKVWVMEEIKKAAIRVGYDYDEETEAKISAMIDDTCDLAKILVTK